MDVCACVCGACVCGAKSCTVSIWSPAFSAPSYVAEYASSPSDTSISSDTVSGAGGPALTVPAAVVAVVALAVDRAGWNTVQRPAVLDEIILSRMGKLELTCGSVATITTAVKPEVPEHGLALPVATMIAEKKHKAAIGVKKMKKIDCYNHWYSA